MSSELVARHSRPVPRYTSYPTAPHFHAGIDDATYAGWLDELPAGTSLSLYIHVPYCDRLCWFCGCHTKQTKRYEPIAAYLADLHHEIRAVAARVRDRATVTALHLGGGSPSMLAPDDFVALNQLLRQEFAFDPEAEISIEVDPNDMDQDRYDALATIGITRLSLGVQDFDPRVQLAINRLQTFEQTKAVVDEMRARGVMSVNLDILYGLPYQTLDTVRATVEQVLLLTPDRVALFGYAHVPWLKTHQRLIDEQALPGPQSRFEQARSAAQQLVAGGFDAIGIDHFARPWDKLARAAAAGTLHRNFQGYTSDAPDALVGLGASAIGQLPQGYVQNATPVADYRRRARTEGTATVRGFALTPDDRVRGYVIERLMCDYAVSTRALKEEFGAASEPVIRDMHLTVACDADGLTEMDAETFRIRALGRPFVRSIAAAFDAYLTEGGARYSTAV